MGVADLATRVTQVADGLCGYLDASPSPFHAVGSAATLLADRGFTEVFESDPTPTGPGGSRRPRPVRLPCRW